VPQPKAHHHVPVGLLWVESAPSGPPRLVQSKPRGAKAAGLRYERSVAKAIPGAVHGPWFRYADQTGSHWCQPDFYKLLPEAVLVLEAKLTWTPNGHQQIFQLYSPVLGKFFNRPVHGIVVCKNLTPETNLDWVCSDLTGAITRSLAHLPTIWHYLA